MKKRKTEDTPLPGERNFAVEKRPVAGAGSGAFAKRAVASGTVLTRAHGFVTRSPTKLGVFEEMCRACASDSKEEQALAQALRERCDHFCPSEVDDALIRQTGWDTEAEALAAIRDAFPKEAPLPTVSEMILMGVRLDRNSFFEGTFPLAAMYNHSCSPNCIAMFDEPSGQMVVRSIEDVQEGDQLFISYLAEASWHHPARLRRGKLSEQYGFDCMCRRCKAADAGEGSEEPPLQNAERALEALMCQHGCSGGFHFVQNTGCSAEPSYTECSGCGRGGEGTGTAPAEVQQALREADKARAEEGLEAEYRALLDVAKRISTALHPNHWLAYQVHERLKDNTKHLSVQASQSDAPEWREYVECHMRHCELLLDCVQNYPPNSHIVAHFEEETAEGIRSLLIAKLPLPAGAKEKEKKLARAAARKLATLLGVYDSS